ncbi:MAG: PAS domain-containing hybrid sensor histidine kinase/response regulator [Methyloligellaceae bacterium]
MSDQDAKTSDPSRSGAEAAEPRLAALSLDRAGDAVYWIDAAGRIVYANETASRMLGYGGDELTAMTLADIDPDVDPKAWPAIWAKIKDRQPTTFEGHHRAKSGDLVPVEVSVHVLTREGEELACGFVRDISERRRAEEALQATKEQADRANEAKTRFLAAASHDLRQPLHAMELLVSALSGKPLAAEAQSIVADMQDSLTFARRLLDSLLDVSELEAGTLKANIEDVPLAPLLRRIHQQYLGIADEKGLALKAVPSSLVVRSDPGLLERIFDNLVSNAVRYTDAGRVLMGCRRCGGVVRLEVWDSGPGIPESDQGKIFDDFCQLDSSAKERGAGLGLGLGLVRRLAELLNHEVRLRSAPGRGSVFWVELEPTAHEAPAESAPGRQGSLAADEAEATIMIIEDDAMVLNAMRTVLEAWGYRVVAVTSAEAARAAETIPDVVIADYRLPGGETGDRAILALRDRAGRVLPGVIVTGEVLPAAMENAAEQGLQVMKKPVRPAKLRALLRHLLQG